MSEPGVLREHYDPEAEDIAKMSLLEQRDHYQKTAAENEEKLIEVMHQRDDAQGALAIHERYLRVMERAFEGRLL